jgi:hypothetical protein
LRTHAAAATLDNLQLVAGIGPAWEVVTTGGPCTPLPVMGGSLVYRRGKPSICEMLAYALSEAGAKESALGAFHSVLRAAERSRGGRAGRGGDSGLLPLGDGADDSATTGHRAPRSVAASGTQHSQRHRSGKGILRSGRGSVGPRKRSTCCDGHHNA